LYAHLSLLDVLITYDISSFVWKIKVIDVILLMQTGDPDEDEEAVYQPPKLSAVPYGLHVLLFVYTNNS
jgi:hypothetical protein